MARAPRKITRRTASATEAVTTAVMAIADAAQRGAGLNLEATFPEGRIRVQIGAISVVVGQPPLKQ